VIICKIDAVYSEPGGRVRIVDWKTGRAPKDAADLERKQLQLALYRLAYSRWAGIPEDRIDAAFYFVADDRVLEPDRIDSEEQLLTRWRAATTPAG
jgi:DNA helicase-2/ATP-dependent DNA helicase PcrA